LPIARAAVRSHPFVVHGGLGERLVHGAGAFA
jgi:hypothetical protein